jgi:hypothetical protein
MTTQSKDLDIGARVPVGVSMRFWSVQQLEIFFEVAPGLVLVEVPEGSLDVALGGRWYF